MRQHDIRFGLGGGILVSLLSWSGNDTPQFVSIFPDGLTLFVLIALFFGVVRVQRREMGSVDLATTVRQVVPVAVVCGLVMAATMVWLGMTHFTHFTWGLFAFEVLGPLVSCVVWATVAATAGWVVRGRTRMA